MIRSEVKQTGRKAVCNYDKNCKYMHGCQKRLDKDIGN